MTRFAKARPLPPALAAIAEPLQLALAHGLAAVLLGGEESEQLNLICAVHDLLGVAPSNLHVLQCEDFRPGRQWSLPAPALLCGCTIVLHRLHRLPVEVQPRFRSWIDETIDRAHQLGTSARPRWVATGPTTLASEVAAGRLDAGLYYRLSGIEVILASERALSADPTPQQPADIACVKPVLSTLMP